MKTVAIDDVIAARELRDVQGEPVQLPHAQHWTHIQFRRFAGCPVCSLHLQAFARRHAELQSQGLQEIVVFHSAAEKLQLHYATVPFSLIADPHRVLYAEFGVNTGLRSVLHPASWPAALGGLVRFGPSLPARGESALGLPADFLVDPQGRVRAAYYGRHADDNWSVDELFTRKQALSARS